MSRCFCIRRNLEKAYTYTHISAALSVCQCSTRGAEGASAAASPIPANIKNLPVVRHRAVLSLSDHLYNTTGTGRPPRGSVLIARLR